MEVAESKVNKCEEMLKVGRISLFCGSIDASNSSLETSATDEPLKESTMIPFLNLGKFVLSRIVKSCLLTADCSNKDSAV